MGNTWKIEKVSSYKFSKFWYYLAFSIDQNLDLNNIKSTSVSLVRGSSCGGSGNFVQKQSQLLVLGLEFDKKHVLLEFDLCPSVAIEKCPTTIFPSFNTIYLLV